MSTVHHTGAGTSHRAPRRMPRRLSPRRTARFMGIRVTPRAHEGLVGGLGAAAFIVTVFDFDNDPTVWTPTLYHIITAIFG